MNPEEKSRYFIPERYWALVSFLIIFLFGFFMVVPHMFDDAWYDEVYTLLFFADSDPLKAFRDYHEPNNHILFTFFLTVWRGFGESIPFLRLLPLLFFLLTLLTLMIVTERLGGLLAGVLAGMFFSTSHTVLNFAVELRGYGLSWLPVTGALLLLPPFLQSGRCLWGCLYVLTAAFAVGVLPTNLMVFFVLSVWAILLIFSSGIPDYMVLKRLTVIIMAPFVGLLAYIMVWRWVVFHSGYYGNSFTLINTFKEWYWATLIDFWWILPIGLLGVFVMVNNADCTAKNKYISLRQQLLLGVSCIVIPPLVYSAVPNVPFSRTLVPLLPLWYSLLALTVAMGWKSIFNKSKIISRNLAMILLCAIAVFGIIRESKGAGYKSRYELGDSPYGIYDQYFHHEFNPGNLVGALDGLIQKKPLLLVFDEVDRWAIYYVINKRRQDPNFIEKMGDSFFVYFKEDTAQLEVLSRISDHDVYIISPSLESATQVVKHLNLPIIDELREIYNTGFLKIYSYQ